MGRAESAVRSQEKAIKRLREFLRDAAKLCEQRGLKLIDAYLVGSRARGDYLDESDIDVVLIIDGVQGMNRLQRIELLSRALKPGIDLLIYTPEEWNSDLMWIKELRRGARQIRKLLASNYNDLSLGISSSKLT